MEKFKVGDLVVSERFNDVLTIKEVIEEAKRDYHFDKEVKKTVISYTVNENGGIYSNELLKLATNNDLARELQAKVEKWISQTFNQVNLSVYEKCLGNMLYEHIEPISDEDIEDEVGLLNERIEELEESEEITDEIQKEIDNLYGDISELENERDSLQDDNYPIWNTIFEVKSSWSWDKLNQFAQNVGMGMINSNDYFNESFFFTSAGHSFYSAYWIPLYLSLFGDTIASKYKNVNYEGL